MIVCGAPGAGKSTFARRLVDEWGAMSYASETFTEALGPVARTPTGDLSKEALEHAYFAMEETVTAALANHGLVVAVGAFRSIIQRRRFRDVALRLLTAAPTVRIACPVDMAAERVLARRVRGDNGPTEDIIRQIDRELASASDIDFVVPNSTSIEQLHKQADALMKAML
jgi:predicted kinase